MRERECQAPIHSQDCPCQKCHRESCGNCHLTNIDHFTPKCIAKLWGWNRKQLNSPDNLQWLSRPCHTDKDRTTPDRKRLLQEQMRGNFMGLEDYKEMLKNHES